MGCFAPPAQHLLSSFMGLQIPLEPAGDAEAENMELTLPSIRLLFSFHKIPKWEEYCDLGGGFRKCRI